jgi:magnesium chelatase subunit D
MVFPFAALVGQEQLKTALLLNAIYPAIGGVLIRGEKGTAKSTAARSLASMLVPLSVVEGCPFHCDPAAIWRDCPHCSAIGEHRPVQIPAPFIDLPLGATEDRVLGTLDFERALREGRRAFQPGLLAGAHRGILYIDEVNLLPDHLVDVMLDAAAIGVNTVQREGVSVIHPSRFLLIGTMNPEEGDLRPQLLDRFGMMVQVAGPREPAVRAEVVRRRLAFEADPVHFEAAWENEQNILRERIVAARAILPRVEISESLLLFICQLCCEFEVDGLRADLALHKASKALAAFSNATAVALEDIKAAAELILPHRRKRRPFEQPHLDQQKLDQHFDAKQREAAKPEPIGESQNPGSRDRESESAGPQLADAKAPDQVFDGAASQAIRRLAVISEDTPQGLPRGRRNHVADGERGRFVRAIPDQDATTLAVSATIRAAALRGPREGGGLAVTSADLHRKECETRTGTLLLFVVDASGSMAARRRMELVKGTVLGLLRSAYQQRDEVAVIAFRGLEASVLLPATRNVELAEQVLRVLPTGGRTPLAHALVVASEVVKQRSRSHDGLPILLVLLSDGRTNVSLPGTSDPPWQQALEAAEELAGSGVTALVLDTHASFVQLGRVEELARALGATLLPQDDLSAENLILKLRRQMT